jgi:hypothetical protein
MADTVAASAPTPPPSAAPLFKLKISAIALLPFVLAVLVLLAPLYAHSKGRPLLGEAWKDVLVCLGAAGAFLLLSFAVMFIPWNVESQLQDQPARQSQDQSQDQV